MFSKHTHLLCDWLTGWVQKAAWLTNG
eukprot:COSAG01_NODE_75723_length_193_cov_48.744681_2_plen_26_part_01